VRGWSVGELGFGGGVQVGGGRSCGVWRGVLGFVAF